MAWLAACDGKKEEIPVIPPLTSPLSQPVIGFGVVNVSYIRIAAFPEEDSSAESASSGYLRRGSIVPILRRQVVNNQGKGESWVLVAGTAALDGGANTGWLRESLVDIYDSESQARTASESMGR